MQTHEPWYLGERAEHLAMVLLTSFDGVRVERLTAGKGIDLLVSVASPVGGGRVFGVEVKGVRRLSAIADQNGRVRESCVEQLAKIAGDSPYPVGLLAFDMSDDSAYFGWYLAPAFEHDGHRASVVPTDEIRLQQIRPDDVQTLAAEVSDWYDARVRRPA